MHFSCESCCTGQPRFQESHLNNRSPYECRGGYFLVPTFGKNHCGKPNNKPMIGERFTPRVKMAIFGMSMDGKISWVYHMNFYDPVEIPTSSVRHLSCQMVFTATWRLGSWQLKTSRANICTVGWVLSPRPSMRSLLQRTEEVKRRRLKYAFCITHTDQYGIPQRFSCQDSRAGLSVGWGDGLVRSAMRSELRGA